ncbi:MAG: inorganic phosphate transporter [Bacteroides sp.]|jgi:phosphate/sulfate permease|nr:inorganic phosphate transporter [Bacteroides sp.]
MLSLIFLTSGLFLGWSLGSNDAANIFGTAVGSRMISFKKAAWIASIFVVIGAVFQGRGATETLSSLGSVDALAGAFTVSLCAAITVFLMTRSGLPVSTSQAVVGAIVGWSAFAGRTTDYGVLTKIVSTWVTGPLLGMVFAALLYLLLRRSLLRMQIHVIKLDYIIRIGLILAGAFGAYSLGANNIANVMGVFVASAPDVMLDFGLFTLDGVQILFLIGSIAISVGIFTYSHKVIETVGRGILALTSEAALVVVLAQALVLFLFSSSSFSGFLQGLGLPSLPLVPVSSTQVVIGAVLGIGLVKGVNEIKGKILGSIAIGWVATPLVAGIFTYLGLFFVQNVFGLVVVKETATIETAVVQTEAVNRGIQNFNLILPGLLVLAALAIALLLFLFFRQRELRLKTENELLVHQNQSYNSQKALSELEINTIQMENTMLSNKLELKRQELNNLLMNISEQRAFLENISNQINELIGQEDIPMRDARLKELSVLLKQKMSFTKELDEYYGQIEKIHKDFQIKLSNRFPDLTENEKRLATLVRLNFSTKEIATFLNISAKSVEIARYRLRKKLELKPGENLPQFLINL